MNNLTREKWFGRGMLALVGIGIFLRLNRYVCAFPFWGDEAWVAWDIMTRSWQKILLNIGLPESLPLPPVGLMLVEKLLIMSLGPCELIFRFFPCACGIAAVFLFRTLLKRLVRPGVVLIGVMFFVFSGSLLYYSSELKQYSSDILVSIAVYVAHFRALKRGLDDKSMLRLAIVGMAGLIFSLPIILVLCGIALAQIAIYFHRRRSTEMGKYLLVFGFWLSWFCALWLKYYYVNFAWKDVLLNYTPDFLSFPLTLGDWRVWTHKVFSIFQNPVGLTVPGLAALLFLAGCWSFRGRKEIVLALVMPVLLTIGLSMVNKYPFLGRYLIFLLPIFYILIAQGVDQVMSGRCWRRAVGVVILCILMVQPAAHARRYLFPSGLTDIRSFMGYLRTNKKTGDCIYVNNESQWGFYFYSSAVSLPMDWSKVVILKEYSLEPDHREGFFYFRTSNQKLWKKVDSWDYVARECRASSGMFDSRRAWVLFSQIDLEKERSFIRNFDSVGRRLDELKSHNARLYLYELK